MMRVVIMLLMAASVYGQVPLEDYACRTNITVTKGNPTLITCDEDHGFDKGHASAWLRVIAEPQSGDTFTIGSTTYRFLADASWGSCQANDIRIPAAGEAGWTSTTRLYNMSNAAHDAINAASTGWYYNGTNYLRRNSAGVEYCAGTTAHADVEAWFRPTSKFLIRAKTAGVAGAGISLSSSNSSRLFWAGWTESISTNQTRHYWFAHIQGGTGNWSSINRYTNQFGTGNNLVWQAYSTARNAFAINFDSSAIVDATPGAGTLKINRSDAGGYPFAQIAGQYAGPWITEVFGPGYFQVTIPSCTAATPITDCHKGYSRFSNDKYGYRKTIQNFTVSSGVAEVRIDKWDDTIAVAGGYEALTAGTPVFVAGFKHLTALGAGYSEAAKFHTCGTTADMQTCGMVRLAYVDQSNSSYTIIRFNTTLPDGTYAGSCANSACTPFATAHVGSAFRAHPYVYYKPLFTTSNTRFFPLDSPSFHAKGTTPGGVNRIRFHIKTQKNLAQGAAGYNVNLGSFPTAPSAVGNTHFYHYSALDFHANRWMLIEYNNTPSHQVDGPNGANWWENPTSEPGHIYGNQWKGSYPGAPAKTMTDHQSTFYFDGNGRTYTQTSADGLGWSGQTVFLSSLILDKVENEPEEFVQSRAGGWAPQRFLNRDTTLTASPGYCAYFSGPVTYDVGYRVRYATSSIKTLGWSNATDPGTQPYRTGGSNISPGFKWCSPQMAEQSSFYVGIRPIIPLLGYSWDGTQHWFSTRNATSMKIGDAVTVMGTGTGADGSRTITAVTPRKIWFRFEPTYISTTWTTPSKLMSIVAADESGSRVCTVNLTETHGLLVGWKVEVVNTTSDVLGGVPSPDSPKIYSISAVPDANSFKFACPGVPINTYNTDRASNTGHMAVMAMPGVAVTAGGAIVWNNSGTIEGTEENKNFAEINLSPYQAPATTSGVPHRLGGFTTSTGAIFFYYSPSAAACALTVSGTGTGSGTFTDSGGVRARVQVLSNLSSSSLYTFALNCGAGEALANGFLITNASNGGSSRAVAVSASMPALATGADNLIIDYGPAPDQLNQSMNASCPGGRCIATLNLSLDTTVWLRRRWCRNGVTDPACANNGNEVARSIAEPMNVR